MRTMLILLVTTFQIVTQIVMIKLILNNNTPVVAAVIDDLTPAHNQIFSDLDKVLNLDNYDPLAVQEYSKFEYSNSSKSFQVEWEKVQENNQRNSGRVPKRNILQNKLGPRNAARFVADPIVSFSLFIPNSLIDSFVKFTNNRNSTFHKQFPELAQIAANRLIDLDEIKAYFGILYLHAALKQNLWDLYSIWYHESSCSISPATMSLNCFSFMTCFLQLDDRSIGEERKKYKEFACFRDFFKKVNENNAKARYRSSY